MAKRRFNWTVAIVLSIALMVVATTAFGLRKWQRNRMAYAGRETGLEAYENRNWEEAVRNLGRYLAVEQSNVEILLKYADAQLNIRPLKEGNVRQTIATYRTILRVDKNNSTAAEKLVSLYLQMNAPAEAELIAQRYLQTNEDPNIRRMLAISLARQREFKQAAAQLKTIIKEHPEQISAYETLGQIAERYPEEFPGKIKYWFDEAVKNNPLSAHAFIARAAFHLRNNEFSSAITDLEEAEKLDLSDSLIRLRLARELANANVFDKAKIHLEAVHAQDPADQALWQTWATCASKTGSKEEMLKVVKTGLKELASSPWDFMPIATELFIRCGEFDRAGDCLDKLKQKDIAPNKVAFLEGLLAEATKQNHKAILSWRKAIQLGDQSQETHLALAAALSRAGDNQSAILQLRTFVTEQPHLFQGHLELARVLSRTGNWAEAAEQARLAMQLAPENIDAVLLHIQARLRLVEINRIDTKEQIWQKIEKQLTELGNRARGKLQVKLLQFQLAMQRGQFAEAEKILTNLKTDEKSPLEVAVAEVDLLTAQGSVNKAISKLHILIEQFPQAALPVKYLAALLAEHRSKEECEKVLKDAMQRSEEPVAKRELGILLAAFYNQWDQNDKSCQVLMALSQELPNDIPIKHQLLKNEQIRKDVSQAQQLVDDIKAIEGEDGWQWRCEQANIWLAGKDFKNQYPKIVALLKENLATNPADQTSRMLLAATYEKAGELHPVVSEYKEALNNSPDDIRIIVPTIAAMYKVKEYEQADKILNRAARQKMVHPELAKLKLQSHLRHGRLSSAESILEDLMAREPDNHTIPLSLALLKMRQNKYDQARELLNKLKVQQPDSLPVIAALVELNISEKKNEEALALCNEVVSQLGNASAYILRGKTYVMLGKNNLAKEDFDRATTVEPDNIQAWLFKSDFNWLMGRLEDALENIRKTLVLDPENVQIQKRAIALLLSSGESDKVRQGLELLDKALASNSQDIELWLYKGRSLLTKGTAPAMRQAESILRRVTEEQPKVADGWVLRAQVYLKQAQPGKAINTVLSGLVYSPNDKMLLLLKAQAEADRSPVLAIPTLKVLKELYPDDTGITLNLANIYVAAGQGDEGISLLKNLLTHCRKDEQRKIDIALAVALYKNGDKAGAQKKFQSLYQSEPDDSGALLAQAQLLRDDNLWRQLTQKVVDWRQNHPEDTRTPVIIAGNLAATENNQAQKAAEDVLRMVLKGSPDNIEAMISLAMLLQMTGRFDESSKLYQHILTLQPDNVVAINNLAWIICEEQQEYEQALELTRRGLEKAPDYIDLIDTRGVAYYRLGEFNKAVQDFNRCVNLYLPLTPSLVASHFHLGRALAKLGQKSEAAENLSKTLELNTTIGGLPAADFAEARRLLEELSQGG